MIPVSELLLSIPAIDSAYFASSLLAENSNLVLDLFGCWATKKTHLPVNLRLEMFLRGPLRLISFDVTPSSLDSAAWVIDNLAVWTGEDSAAWMGRYSAA